jgi:hypothetical protein
MLRVNTNLIQLPVLVLSTNLEKLSKPIASDRFSIGFNGGSPFRPKFVRAKAMTRSSLPSFWMCVTRRKACCRRWTKQSQILRPLFCTRVTVSPSMPSMRLVDCRGKCAGGARATEERGRYCAKQVDGAPPTQAEISLR